MQNEHKPTDQRSSTSLPALLPPVTLLIQRTQTTLGLLHNVVEESSAHYWYERGIATNENEDWDEAIYCFGKYLGYKEDGSTIYYALCGLLKALENRAEFRLRHGDMEGFDLDNEYIEWATDYLDYVIAMIENSLD